jgi:cyanophycin synthetase
MICSDGNRDFVERSLIKNNSTTTYIILEELLSRGMEVDFVSWPELDMRFSTKSGDIRTIRGVTCSKSSGYARSIASNKYRTLRFAQGLGLSVSPFYLINSGVSIPDIWEEYNGEVVAKIVDVDGGKGVFGGFSSLQDLQAFANEYSTSNNLLLQKRSSCRVDLRVTFIGDKLIAATIREPYAVVGDGISTLKELISVENKRRSDYNNACMPLARVFLISLEKASHRSGYDSGTVLGNGDKVVITTGNISEGATTKDVTSSVHTGYIEYAKRITDSLNTSVISVDFLVNKASIYDLGELNGAIFLEINSRPGLSFQQYPEEGTGPDIAKAYVDYVIGDCTK